MRHLFYVISFIFTGVVCIIAIVTVLIKSLIILRRRVPVKVNCWFCNSWTKVHYDNRNSFECPTCLQYNGFTKSGDYNKYIPEQHEEVRNKYLQALDKNRQLPTKNGLCSTCNYNQQLRVLQLAEFEPFIEENYDVEVEHFRKQLEKTYQLCPKCEEVLQETIYRQNAFIIGNRVKQLKNNNSSSLLGHEITALTRKESIPLSLIGYSIILFASLILLNLFTTFDYSDNNLRKQLHPKLFHLFRHVKHDVAHGFSTILAAQTRMFPILNEIGQYITDSSNYLSEKVTLVMQNNKISSESIFLKAMPNSDCLINATITSIAGLLLQVIFSVFGNAKLLTKASQVISWILMVLLIVFPLKKTNGATISLLQVVLAIYIIYSMLANSKLTSVIKQKQKKNKKRKQNIRRLNKSETFSDFSDNEVSELKKFNSSFNSTDTAGSECDITSNKLFSPIKLHNNTINNTAPCNRSFTNESDSFRNATSPDYNQHERNHDLNTSLSNLYLNTSTSNACCKQLLSPPKLKTVMQNPWTAGGFWHNTYTCVSPPPTQIGESRSSSQSSGFISQTQEQPHFNSLPASRANSCNSIELEKASVLSEPLYNLNNMSVSPRPGFVKSRQKNTFYPTLNANETLCIQTSASLSNSGVAKTDFYWRNQGLQTSPLSNVVISKNSAFCGSTTFKNPKCNTNLQNNFSFSDK